jgi:hypothetical protein
MYAGFLYKKTYRYDIPEILLKVALNTITLLNKVTFLIHSGRIRNLVTQERK